MRTYVGIRQGGLVTVIVRTSSGPRPLRHIAYHSPSGMEWGYPGSGPADLALSILVDSLGEHRGWQEPPLGRSRVPYDSRAWDLHQGFKRDVVGRFAREPFQVTDAQVMEWVSEHEAPEEALEF